ncbi:hypothetical protein D3C84_151070 [compost metagenome]
MKAYLRLCLILLISLALPLSGMAGVAASVEPCPMQASGMAMMADMDQDCCQDMEKAAEHGKACKPGQECKSSSVLQVPTVKSATHLSSPMVVSLTSDFLPPKTPTGVWRPPCV